MKTISYALPFDYHLLSLLCRVAAQRWDGEGALLFTSSSAVYDVHDNGFCDEVGLYDDKKKFPIVIS